MSVFLLLAIATAPMRFSSGSLADRAATATVAPAYGAQRDSARLCLHDAVSGTPVVGATVVTTVGTQLLASDCARLPVGQLLIRRIGYRAQSVTLRGDLQVALTPLAARATLDTVRVVSADDDDAAQGNRLSATAARERGASTVPDLVSMLPFTQLQQTRGATVLSLRGARREHTVVTLDGIVLNDPSTGLADIGELPLTAINGASVHPGAGGGAIGGVLALQSTTAPLIMSRVGAFGERAAEATARLVTTRVIWHGGGAFMERRNDFSFRNTSAAAETAPVEQRVNNDESRASLFTTLLGDRWRVMATASRIDRGMVGAMNVRTYDHDRGRTDRGSLEAQAQVGGAQLRAGARVFHLEYRDPMRPAFDNDARAQVLHADISTRWKRIRWASGAGADAMRASNGLRQSRSRGYISGSIDEQLAATRVDVTARVDAVEGNGVLPTFGLGASRTLRAVDTSLLPGIDVRARVAQAVRVPTLYDLYFSSPQRVTVRALRAERVLYDAELATTLAWKPAPLSVALSSGLVARRVRDAIVWFPGNFSWSPANVGIEQMFGVESQLQMASGPVVLDGWFSWYDSWLTSGELRIPTPYVSRDAAGARVALERGPSTLSTNARFLGRRPFTVGPRDPLYELPALTLVDVALSHHVSLSRFSTLLSLSLENLTDQAWQSVRGFPEPGRRWSVALFLTPRSAR